MDMPVDSIRDDPDEPKGNGTNYTPEHDDDDDDDMDEMNPTLVRYHYSPGIVRAPQGTTKQLLTSQDFGQNWTWAPMPDYLQAGGVYVDPTSQNSLFALTDSCLAHSTDNGRTWSACSDATGLTGAFSKLLIKNSQVMFMLRRGAVPLRTTDGGSSWQGLASAASL